jgi:IS1 family transposase
LYWEILYRSSLSENEYYPLASYVFKKPDLAKGKCHGQRYNSKDLKLARMPVRSLRQTNSFKRQLAQKNPPRG